jgi:hypothetical protein
VVPAFVGGGERKVRIKCVGNLAGSWSSWTRKLGCLAKNVILDSGRGSRKAQGSSGVRTCFYRPSITAQ